MVVWVGECLAFSIPAAAWGMLEVAGVPALVIFAGVAVAGIGEGAVLGFAQSRVLPLFVRGIDARRWVRFTALGAGVAWALGMLPSTLNDLGAPLAVTDDLAHLARGDLVFWKGHVGVMRDATTLLHANGHHMLVASEPLLQARERIARNSFGAITAIKRLGATA